MPKYPSIPAGRRITAALLDSMVPMEVSKTFSTDRASNTTLADDPDLTFQLEANAVYHIEFYLHFGAINAARIKTQWTAPAGAIGNRSAVGPDTGAILSATSGGQGRWGVHNYTTPVIYGNRDPTATNLVWALEESVITTTNAGTCAIQWAQDTSNATATRMGAGSYGRARRIA